MLAENNEVLQEAVDTVYQLSQDERIREQCQAREDYERMMNAINLRLENAEAALEEKDREIETKDKEADKMSGLGMSILMEGIEQGIEQGEERFVKLGQMLQRDGRMEDLLRAMADRDLRMELYEEYGICIKQETAGV